MHGKLRIAAGVLLAAAIFFGGYAAGQAKYGQPKTIIHISLIKWKADASDADKAKVLSSFKEMVGKIPGVKNIWTKPSRMQPRDFHTAFAIEFENRAAADRYATDRAHEAWSKEFLAIREASISPQITNE
ncbi:MAG: Dabb family protein [Acidobacteria bacterium]|nr:Dabb family protein [Acidobacteriota bacterium]